MVWLVGTNLARVKPCGASARMSECRVSCYPDGMDARRATVRILTWNIHKGIGGVDRRYDLKRIIELIAHYSPDFALLQEVADRLPRANHHNQAEVLAEALGMPHMAYHPQHQFVAGGYGNLILSRWPLT